MTDDVLSDRALSANSTLSSKRDSDEIHEDLQKAYEGRCLSRPAMYKWINCFREGSETKDNHRKGHTVPAASEQRPRYSSE